MQGMTGPFADDSTTSNMSVPVRRRRERATRSEEFSSLCEMRSADDRNEMEPFDLVDERATVSIVKATKESSREGAKDVK